MTSPASPSEPGRRDAAIELADSGPRGWGRVRQAAGWLHLAVAAAVLVAVFAQVYLIGAYIFGAGQGALDAHKAVGWGANELELVVLICGLVAWLPRRDVLLSLALALVGTVQVSLASGHRWVGGLHPLLALAVFITAGMLVRRRLRAYGVSSHRH
ncbi:MAG TPA: hypothetical protein VMF14_17510 [Solirubrobacteraceae bacterium]|nr:hypothetical protein [Solirubrobacteraceae bacterium]